MKALFRRYIWVFAAAALGGCDSADLPTGSPILVDSNNNGQLVVLGKEQTLVVTLEANPTTGYTWEVAKIDDSILYLMGEAQFVPQSPDVGAGGTQTFRFQAMSAGRTNLSLVYHRPWEPEEAPLKTFSLSVLVR
jgi:inhibitor of cysteine peptidase